MFETVNAERDSMISGIEFHTIDFSPRSTTLNYLYDGEHPLWTSVFSFVNERVGLDFFKTFVLIIIIPLVFVIFNS